DQKAFVLQSDVLDVGILVAGRHDEVGSYGANRLVLGSCCADLLHTVPVVALAEKLHQLFVRRNGLADVLDLLVDLPDEGPVPFWFALRNTSDAQELARRRLRRASARTSQPHEAMRRADEHLPTVEDVVGALVSTDRARVTQNRVDVHPGRVVAVERTAVIL